MKQKIQLSDHFGYKKLARFTIPSILMMIVTSVYGVIDGFFILIYYISLYYFVVYCKSFKERFFKTAFFRKADAKV